MKITPASLQILNDLKVVISDNAKLKGFRDQLTQSLTQEQINGPVGQLLKAAVFVANQTGEDSEFWEAYRGGTLYKPCNKAQKMVDMGLPGLTCAEEEIADIIIRALDMSEAYGVDIAKAVATKIAFNASRPKLHGGKLA